MAFRLQLSQTQCNNFSDLGQWDFPEFILVDEPRDVTVQSGKLALLDCSAKGQPPPEIKWKKDGILMDFPNSDRRLLSNGSLYLGGTKEQPGVYQCIVTQPEVGTILSTTARVKAAGLLSFESFIFFQKWSSASS